MPLLAEGAHGGGRWRPQAPPRWTAPATSLSSPFVRCSAAGAPLSPRSPAGRLGWREVSGPAATSMRCGRPLPSLYLANLASSTIIPDELQHPAGGGSLKEYCIRVQDEMQYPAADSLKALPH